MPVRPYIVTSQRRCAVSAHQRHFQHLVLGGEGDTSVTNIAEIIGSPTGTRGCCAVQKVSHVRHYRLGNGGGSRGGRGPRRGAGHKAAETRIRVHHGSRQRGTHRSYNNGDFSSGSTSRIRTRAVTAVTARVRARQVDAAEEQSVL